MNALTVSLLCLALMIFVEDTDQTEVPRNIVAVQLAGGWGGTEGRLEVLVSGGGRWGTVCRHSFTDASARVACRMLGWPSNTSAVVTIHNYGPDRDSRNPILFDRIQCVGDEESLNDCPESDFDYTCYHYQDVAIICDYPEITDIRLYGGISDRVGRLEVFGAGQWGVPSWGTVCDDYFDDRSAQVVCRQLGFLTGSSRVADMSIFQGMRPNFGRIMLDNVQCLGNETNILACPHSRPGVHNCDHSDDVAIVCDEEKTVF